MKEFLERGWKSLKTFLREEDRPDVVAFKVVKPEVRPSTVEAALVVEAEERSANFALDTQPLKPEIVVEQLSDLETLDGVQQNWERMKRILQEEVQQGRACNYVEKSNETGLYLRIVFNRGVLEDWGVEVRVFPPWALKLKCDSESFQVSLKTGVPSKALLTKPVVAGKGDGLYLHEEQQEKISTLFANRGVKFMF